MLIAHGEQLARALEVDEARCRAKRGAVRALANLWVYDGRRSRPIQMGRAAIWALGDGNANVPEGITGMRAGLARERGHALPPEPQPPDRQAILDRLLIDPDAELGGER